MRTLDNIVAINAIEHGRVVKIYYDTHEARQEEHRLLEERQAYIGIAMADFEIGARITGIFEKQGLLLWPEQVVKAITDEQKSLESPI